MIQKSEATILKNLKSHLERKNSMLHEHHVSTSRALFVIRYAMYNEEGINIVVSLGDGRLLIAKLNGVSHRLLGVTF